MSIVTSAAILVVTVGLAIGALLFVRRGAPEGSYFADGDRASGVFGVLATGFAIFAGFVVFLAFTSYDQSRSGAEREALTVIQQFQTAQFLPESVSERLSGELECYGRYVIGKEWPDMESGDAGNTINPWGLALFRSLQTVEPETPAQEAAYGKWLDQTSDREEARRDRIHGASGIIPTSVWVVLFLIAGVVFAFMLFFADSAERKRSQAMLIGSATTVVVATLLVINALDNPYGGNLGSIEPDAMERSLVLLGEARAAIGSTDPVPCDDGGNPSG